VLKTALKSDHLLEDYKTLAAGGSGISVPCIQPLVLVLYASVRLAIPAPPIISYSGLEDLGLELDNPAQSLH
jgi:hypothetical protein